MTIQTLADELGVHLDDVRVVAGWLTDRPDVDDALDSVLGAALHDILDPDGERTARDRACPGCARMPGAGLILAGWHPCRCGGHRTTLCREDTDGCGYDRFEPELTEHCIDPGFGFSAP